MCFPIVFLQHFVCEIKISIVTYRQCKALFINSGKINSFVIIDRFCRSAGLCRHMRMSHLFFTDLKFCPVWPCTCCMVVTHQLFFSSGVVEIRQSIFSRAHKRDATSRTMACIGASRRKSQSCRI